MKENRSRRFGKGRSEYLIDVQKGCRDEIMERLRTEQAVEDERLSEVIDQVLSEREAEVFFSLSEKMRLKENLFNGFRKLDILQELIDDKSITEVMINGASDIFIERNGKMERWGKRFESAEKLEDIIQQIVSRINRRVNTASPIVDARLPNGSRVHVVLPPVALCGPTMTIRKFPKRFCAAELVSGGSISEEAMTVLKVLVRAGYNIFISGGTGSGKSTFLNALSEFIPGKERVITIEDSAELKLSHIENLVSMETRNPNTEGEGEITMSMLIKASLRMRPEPTHNEKVRTRKREALTMKAIYHVHGSDGSFFRTESQRTATLEARRLASMTGAAASIVTHWNGRMRISSVSPDGRLEKITGGM